ncbi:hypothetical protein [Tsukamurella sp. NPDC003166]|uniref:hypothetical protein n=1 Tax=Tsukamurella sp. NPDC003166 TaxID=3154444 RepID=UPI0033BB43C5
MCRVERDPSVLYLAAARSCGQRTAYVERPREWGTVDKPEQREPLDAYHTTGMDDLADQLVADNRVADGPRPGAW